MCYCSLPPEINYANFVPSAQIKEGKNRIFVFQMINYEFLKSWMYNIQHKFYIFGSLITCALRKHMIIWRILLQIKYGEIYYTQELLFILSVEPIFRKRHLIIMWWRTSHMSFKIDYWVGDSTSFFEQTERCWSF